MNTPTQYRSIGTRALYIGAAFVVLMAGLKAAEPLLVPFMFAVFLAILGSGPLHVLKKLHCPTTLAVLIVTLAMVGLLTGIGALLAGSVNDFARKIPEYQDRAITLNESLKNLLVRYKIEALYDPIFNQLNPNTFVDQFLSGLRGLVETLSKLFLVIIMMIFMLLEAADFRFKLRVALGSSSSKKTERFDQTAYNVQRYLGIKTFTSIVTGVAITLLNIAVGTDFPFLWGLIAFLLNYIPFIGSTIASVPAIVVALLQFGVPEAVTLGIGYLILNTAISNFFEPILLGRRLGLSPLVVFLSLIVWGLVWGPAGALMSVPLTMILRILLEQSDEFRWIAVLMGPRPTQNEMDSEEAT